MASQLTMRLVPLTRTTFGISFNTDSDPIEQDEEFDEEEFEMEEFEEFEWDNEDEDEVECDDDED